MWAAPSGPERDTGKQLIMVARRPADLQAKHGGHGRRRRMVASARALRRLDMYAVVWTMERFNTSPGWLLEIKTICQAPLIFADLVVKQQVSGALIILFAYL